MLKWNRWLRLCDIFYFKLLKVFFVFETNIWCNTILKTYHVSDFYLLSVFGKILCNLSNHWNLKIYKNATDLKYFGTQVWGMWDKISKFLILSFTLSTWMRDLAIFLHICTLAGVYCLLFFKKKGECLDERLLEVEIEL